MTYYGGDGQVYNNWNNQLAHYTPPGPTTQYTPQPSHDNTYQLNKEAEEYFERRRLRAEAWGRHVKRWRRFKKWVCNVCDRILCAIFLH